jgi:hypothetical protein
MALDVEQVTNPKLPFHHGNGRAVNLSFFLHSRPKPSSSPLEARDMFLREADRIVGGVEAKLTSYEFKFPPDLNFHF